MIIITNKKWLNPFNFCYKFNHLPAMYAQKILVKHCIVYIMINSQWYGNVNFFNGEDCSV